MIEVTDPEDQLDVPCGKILAERGGDRCQEERRRACFFPSRSPLPLKRSRLVERGSRHQGPNSERDSLLKSYLGRESRATWDSTTEHRLCAARKEQAPDAVHSDDEHAGPALQQALSDSSDSKTAPGPVFDLPVFLYFAFYIYNRHSILTRMERPD